MVACVEHSLFHFTMDLCLSELLPIVPKQLLPCLFPHQVHAFSLAVGGGLNPPVSLEMAVCTLNKASPLENPLETSVHGEEIGLLNQASIQATSDQLNSVGVTHDMTKQNEVQLVASPVSQQDTAADPLVCSADLMVPEENVSLRETPVVSSEEPQVSEEVLTQVTQNPEDEKLASQEREKILKVLTSGGKPEVVTEKNSYDPKHCGPEDNSLIRDNGRADFPEAVPGEPTNHGFDPALDELFPGDSNVSLSTQNESLGKTEPVTILSEPILTKGNSRNEDPPPSTCPLSGWFIL